VEVADGPVKNPNRITAAKDDLEQDYKHDEAKLKEAARRQSADYELLPIRKFSISSL
jgi:hypothetical protein